MGIKMGRGVRPFAGLLAAVTNVCSASADAPLQPLKPWVLDYSETQCTAMREYGRADDPLTLGIVPSSNGETVQLLVARKHRSGDAEELQGRVDFGSGAIKAWLLQFGSQKRDVMVDQFRISAEQFQQARSANSVTLHIDGRSTTTFELDAMPQLMDAMQNCLADLHDYWNMDGEKDGRIKTPVKGDIRNDFKANDYPAQAVALTQQGTAQYLLLIDEKGSVAGCDVLKASGVPILDAMGCAVIQEGTKMQPALDQADKPVRSSFVTPPISWKIQ